MQKHADREEKETVNSSYFSSEYGYGIGSSTYNQLNSQIRIQSTSTTINHHINFHIQPQQYNYNISHEERKSINSSSLVPLQGGNILNATSARGCTFYDPFIISKTNNTRNNR
ncbi:unnamed protein product [Lepeophtheirus salmonis]|uniref:(salmon louse) hypothetical protein n=1 Tax=Lepeophtheirus salmonis TaxID=72036 RepID=A0A7R8H1V5_LEPSM|nr:unnamed protein product [Lepeophtheirus salmonis]CAF2814767.1 unnamed protein product [Lepeophtheirus salmonis]